jgi:hypothetical protein
MDDKSHRLGARLSGFRQIAGDVDGPGEVGWAIGDSADEHPRLAQFVAPLVARLPVTNG